MRLSIVFSLILACAVVASREGESRMAHLMSLKLEHRERARSQGLFRVNKYTDKGSTKCVDGKAGEYSCENVDLQGFLSHQALGSTTRWTSADGREFGIVGQTDGTAFVEILDDGSLDSSPTKFSIKNDLTAWYNDFGSSHNIVAHEEENMIYAVGTARKLNCAGGLWMVDVSDPANPVSPGCVNEDGYVHDAQCVIYKGPDKKYTGREICFNYNEDTLTIVDVTDKKTPIQISKTPYVGSSYTHQGWIATEDMAYLLLDDELDEMDGTGEAANGHTTTYVFDVNDLSAPRHTGTYQSPVRSIDHNQYVLNGLTYQANYGSGLRIVDISSIPEDPSGKGLKQVGFFDCHPEDDEEGGRVEFVGSWSVYPYFRSRYILLNSIERGVYSLKYTG
ncbi:uncharacterized protein ATNIH1004_002936 [Aspergillus tanneri]|uniref:Regulatory P domain-containing protein n=1 Tax=Aspergillus tanneri TaxID=1220188 RepID=A0A5M9MY12_9EURO|nr:uncharacterized protein ATNIH1004_002936 [Aspergillus tanneri]KAA8650254.1 hypothetical protein ATNIH1004_002936 [Aspergillus tanneri]